MMDITILCCTHGRPYHLCEAVECYRRMVIPAGIEVEMLVVNDCPEQELLCSEPGVRVLNVPMMNNLSDKMNLCVEYAGGEWIALLDDDDISLPHRLTYSVGYLREHPAVKAIRHTYAWIWEYGRIEKFEKNLFIGSSMMRRDYWFQMGGASHHQWWDQEIWYKMLDHGGAVEIKPTMREAHFIYRWGGIGHHYSGKMKQDINNADELFGIYRRGVKGDRRWVEGCIEIVPEWKQDYIGMVTSAINKRV